MADVDVATVRAWPPVTRYVPGHWTSGTTTAGDGTALHWIETGGDGPPVVLLHGVQVDGLTWVRTALAIEADHRGIMPDLRGHGRSGRVGPGRTSTRTMADDVGVLLDELGVDRPLLVGHSWVPTSPASWPPTAHRWGCCLLEPALADHGAATAFDPDDPPPWMANLFATLRGLPTLPHPDRMEAGLRLLPPGPPVAWDPVDHVAFIDAQARFDLDVYRTLDAFRGLTPEVVAAIDC